MYRTHQVVMSLRFLSHSTFQVIINPPDTGTPLALCHIIFLVSGASWFEENKRCRKKNSISLGKKKCWSQTLMFILFWNYYVFSFPCNWHWVAHWDCTVALTKVWHSVDGFYSSLMPPWLFSVYRWIYMYPVRTRLKTRYFLVEPQRTSCFQPQCHLLKVLAAAERLQLFLRVSIVSFCCLLLHDNKSINEPQLGKCLAEFIYENLQDI